MIRFQWEMTRDCIEVILLERERKGGGFGRQKGVELRPLKKSLTLMSSPPGPQNVTIFGDRVSEEVKSKVIRVDFNPTAAVLVRFGNRAVQKKRRKTATCEPRREAPEETIPADTVTWDLRPPDL